MAAPATASYIAVLDCNVGGGAPAQPHTHSLDIMALFLNIFCIMFLTYGHAWNGKIVFQDNLNGKSLDLSKWEYQEGFSNSELIHGYTNEEFGFNCVCNK